MAQSRHSKGLTLITGASAGIGTAIAKEFASHGHSLALAARNRQALEALAQELRDQHRVEVTVIPADLGAEDGASKLCSQIQSKKLNVEILVNNAGVLSDGPFLDQPLDAHLNTLDVNIRALMVLSHGLGNAMKASGGGRIVNIASTSAFQPVPNLASYAASKAFVLSLSEAMAIECASHGITVTAICPGFTSTELIRKKDGGSMSLPGVPILTPAEVARETYEATMKGRPVKVNGLANRALQVVSELQPRWLTHQVGKLIYRIGL